MIPPLLQTALVVTAMLVWSWMLGKFVSLMAGRTHFGTFGHIALGAIGGSLGGCFLTFFGEVLGSHGDGFLTRTVVCVLGTFGALWAYNGLKDCFLTTSTDP